MATISKLVANPSVVASSSSAWSSDRSILVGSGRYVPFRSIAVLPVRLSIRANQTQKRRVVVKAKSGKEPLKKTTLHSLYEEQGLSPWYDNLCRPVTDLLPLIAKGVRGVTSNPTIFQKAISSSSAYDEQFKFLTGVEGKDVEKAYWEMVIKDIKDACRLFQSIYDETDGGDGYVSVEVSPRLANDTNRTIEAAKWLHKVVNRPNVYIKIPATVECVPSIKEVIANGISVNVTLIFSLARYEAVIDAYLDGLEASSLKDLSRVTSVASFFVSRVDTLIDKKLENIGTPEALDLRGKAAVAQAKLAYKLYQKKFSGPRWEALVKKGAKKQRLLFASTGVKNPAYPDTLYVDSLIGPDTVSTMPDQALEAVLDHGTVKRTIDSKLSEAEGVYSALEKYGINWTQIGTQLELEGVDSFKSSFDSLLISLEEKKSNILKSSKNKKSSTDKDAAEYVKKLDEVQKKTGLTDAVQTGIGEINGIPVAIAVMDFNFIGGSMGSVVGEKITRLIEYATDKTLPVILVCASGGARMQEGSFSLMQMAKISSAMLDYQSKKKSFIVTILSSPTTGGVTASFAMLADVVIGEPDAYIAFAGKIVIEEVMKIKVPEGVQKAEYLFEHGNLDLIVPRYYQKEVLTELLTMHGFPPVGKK